MKIGMPKNWDDHAGWDSYYESQRQVDDKTKNSWDIFSSLWFLESEEIRKLKKIWFPGCGISLAPRAYAEIVYKVWATDCSTNAIEIQIDRLNMPLEKFVPEIKQSIFKQYPNFLFYDNFEIHFLTHDFRKSFEECDFDLIINIKSFQALPNESMGLAARTFWNSLRPGGRIILATMNVQGERRNEIEDSLIQAGFYIPGNKANRWYRKRLDATNIPYVFIMGRPRTDCKMPPGAMLKYNTLMHGQTILNGFRDEYDYRMEKELKEGKIIMNDGKTKIATISYSTG